MEQRNKLLRHANAAATKGRLPEDKSGFINSALMATTTTPPENASVNKVTMADEISLLEGAIPPASA